MSEPTAEHAVAFSRQAWADYQFWAENEPATARRVTRLIADCLRGPLTGIGKPEPLKHELGGCWSRRITKEHRLVYKMDGRRCLIVQCRYHY